MVLEAKNISISIGTKTILDGASFSIRPGEKVVIKGKSGCGKSTLLKVIIGARAVQGGELRMFDSALSAANWPWMKMKLAYVPQKNETTFEGTAAGFICEPLQFRKNKGKQHDPGKMHELAARFGLGETVLSQPVASLSGGEMQRAAIIRALVLDREFLLLDEVTSAIDTGLKKTIIDYVTAAFSGSVLIISHDAEFEARTDRVFMFSNRNLREVHT